MWRETITDITVYVLPFLISIHSLRVEGDCIKVLVFKLNFCYFNPLPPCGGRRSELGIRFFTLIRFQSTPSVWRETFRKPCIKSFTLISIHSLRVEGDVALCMRELVKRISIHSLRVEGDRFMPVGLAPAEYFNPLPPCGGRRRCPARQPLLSYFNPLPPCGGRRWKQCKPKKRQSVFQSTPSVWRETLLRLYLL